VPAGALGASAWLRWCHGAGRPGRGHVEALALLAGLGPGRSRACLLVLVSGAQRQQPAGASVTPGGALGAVAWRQSRRDRLFPLPGLLFPLLFPVGLNACERLSTHANGCSRCSRCSR
jgi:hypothetical protein